MTTLNTEQFVAYVEGAKTAGLRELDRFLQAFAQECGFQVVIGGEFGPGTPVRTGFLRGMWYWDVNGVGHSPELAPVVWKDGSSPTYGVPDMSAITAIRAGNPVALCNNAEYAPFVENGTSNMEPHAMVASVAANVQPIAIKVAKELGWGPKSLIQLDLFG